MQLQFEQKPLNCLRYVLRDVKCFEEVLELRLPDSDGATVLCVQGQPLIRGKEWRNGRVGVNGGVAVTALYICDDAPGVRCCNGWIPFQQAWDVAEREKDGKLLISCRIAGIDVRMTGADKVMVTASLSLQAQALAEHKIGVYRPNGMPEDIYVLTNSYPVCVPVESGEKNWTLDEEVRLPQGKPEVERICCAMLQPGVIEEKLMGDKLVLRGSAMAKVLYVGVDGKLNSMETTIPVSQYLQLDSEYGDHAETSLTMVVTDLETEKGEEGTVRIKGGLLGQYVVYDRPVISLAEDAYSNRREVAPVMDTLSMTQLLDRGEVRQNMECVISGEVGDVVTCDVYAAHPETITAQGELRSHAGGKVQLLYYDHDDKLRCASAPWEFSCLEQAAENVELVLSMSHQLTPGWECLPEEVKLCWDACMSRCAYTETGLPTVVALEAQETISSGKRPAVILRRAGEETLWQIAKQCHSSVEAIREANSITDTVSPQQMLLIPVQ